MNFPALLYDALLDPDEPATEPQEAPRAPLEERLEAYARFVSLVAEQVRASVAGEVGRLRDLMEERAALETELDEDGEALLARALDALDERVEKDQELRDHWRRLQEDALRVTRGLHAPRLHRGRYPQGPSSPAQLDVRF